MARWCCASASAACGRSRWAGVAQAKGFFPALLPLALLFTAGWAALYRALGGRDDALAHSALLGAFILLDWASLGVTLWHHYRWLQVGS